VSDLVDCDLLDSAETAADSGAAPFPGMIWVPGGTFQMGSDRHYPEEAPVHRVTVEGFWMDRHTVTNREFARFVRATGHLTLAERAPDPADYPQARPELLPPASTVFVKPDRRVDLGNHHNWWTYIPGASWRHPQGPGSAVKHKPDHPVVHLAWEDVAVTYAGLGFAASNGSAAAADTAHAAGLRQFTAASIEQAATDAHRSRWAALLVGAVLLYTASGHLLKGFTAMSALAWHGSRRRARPIHILAVVGFGLVVAGLAAAGAALRHHGALSLLALVGFAAVWAALWWLASLLLPHGAAGPLHLVPGALLFGVGIQGLYVLTQVYFSRKIASASELYGALGGAATLLLWLFLLARLAVSAAVVNAVLWDRQISLARVLTRLRLPGRGSGSPPR
jgi:uncharacterized BrkB/YihY/UPF0761 family membrane protein